MTKVKTINPHSGAEIAQYQRLSVEELEQKLRKTQQASASWRNTPIKERADLIRKVGKLLRENQDECAQIITKEMGKPIRESRSEVEKCAWVCDYYAENTASFLEDEVISTDAQRSFVRHDPIGTVLAIMPWNYPFWQVFRFAAPVLTSGNTGLLKHAENVLGCGMLIEDLFTRAGYPEGVFQTLIMDHDAAEKVIAGDTVNAVTLTGSERAGSAVAANAGKHLKKTLLELGGSNAFVVLDDADMSKAVSTAVAARMLNTGQSCIAAKRFIVVESVYDEFVSGFVAAVKKLKSGDPMEESTEIGPMARKDLADELQSQIKDSVSQGAKLLQGGNQKDCFHEPTILGDVKPGMRAFDEETFGPLASVTRAADEETAYKLAAKSAFGLGMTVFTKNIEKALSHAGDMPDGAFFVNEQVKSDPRLPFGGTGKSGYGRELSRDGMMEFINRKTVYIK